LLLKLVSPFSNHVKVIKIFNEILGEAKTGHSNPALRLVMEGQDQATRIAWIQHDTANFSETLLEILHIMLRFYLQPHSLHSAPFLPENSPYVTRRARENLAGAVEMPSIPPFLRSQGPSCIAIIFVALLSETIIKNKEAAECVPAFDDWRDRIPLTKRLDSALIQVCRFNVSRPMPSLHVSMLLPDPLARPVSKPENTPALANRTTEAEFHFFCTLVRVSFSKSLPQWILGPARFQNSDNKGTLNPASPRTGKSHERCEWTSSEDSICRQRSLSSLTL
jgi:hypothetical protein